MIPLELVISPEARDDLIEIWRYIADDNPAKADELIEDIHERCRLIADNPSIGRSREEFSYRLRSFVYRRYIIFYRAKSGVLEIVRVLSGYRDMNGIFKDLE